jgi:hypothetical protein
MEDIRARLMEGVSRSSTVVLSQQIRTGLQRYFAPSELLLVVGSTHAILKTLPDNMAGFNASWAILKGLMQSLTIQMVGAYLTQGQQPTVALFNLLASLVVLECLPKSITGDIPGLTTSVSFIFSDQLGALLTSLGAPPVAASLGFLFGGQGLFGQTLALTAVNKLCSAVFGAVRSAGSLSLAWPVIVLYFVHEASGRFERASAFLDYGLYKASDAIYAGLLESMGADKIGLLFFFLLAVTTHRDEVWTGVCALTLVRAASDWFLGDLEQMTHSDAILGGLCIVTVVHFITVAGEAFGAALKEKNR